MRPSAPVVLPAPWRWLLIAMLLAWGAAQAQPASDGDVAGTVTVMDGDPQPWIRAADLARLLGAEWVVDGETVVLRADGAVLTGWIGSPDITFSGRPAGERSLSAPIRRDADGVWFPLDAAGAFGAARVADDRLVAPSGRAFALRIAPAARVRTDPGATLLRPAPGTVAVELLSPGGDGAPDVLAAWVTDLTMAPLLAPWARAAVDAALADAGSARALLLVVTSLRPEQRHPGLSLRPDGMAATDPGARHETLLGSPDAIGPDAPWVAVVWLPTGARLDQPIEIRARATRATVTFRR
ncbi:MAG: hypothetical protein WD336_09340 [Trueperaceae bacterium]